MRSEADLQTFFFGADQRCLAKKANIPRWPASDAATVVGNSDAADIRRLDWPPEVFYARKFHWRRGSLADVLVGG